MNLAGYIHERPATGPGRKPLCATLPNISQKLWPEFDRYMAERGAAVSLARKNLWYPSLHVDNLPRVVIPSTSAMPGNLYWQARLMEPLSTPYVAEGARRYESPHGVWRGDAIIVVWPYPPTVGMVHGYPMAIAEGPFDALAAAEVGVVGIALMGVTPSAEVLNYIADFVQGAKCVLVMDRDQEEAMAAVGMALAERGIRCKLACPYPAKDLAELTDPAARIRVLSWAT